MRVVDRSGLILDIFAQRARTKEGRLQVQLAQYEYLLPRLTGMWTHLKRQAGTSAPIGTRGPGETQLETDRRHIRRIIQNLQADLEQVRRVRSTQRRRREKNAMPMVALVGYTNAGKSTVLNRLTRSDIPANDRLFDTLDTTTRRLWLPELQREILLSDTVGFIRKLPTNLIEAFKATLEELRYADLLLHVIDVSAPDWEEQAKVTDALIRELGASATPVLRIYNKCDAIPALTELPHTRRRVHFRAHRRGRGHAARTHHGGAEAMTPYRTAAGYGEAEYEDKRSRFIGHIKPVTSENEAKAFIDEMRRTYADATHNVFAYVLREGNILRWSDDGEPGGTSGQPTLAVLQGAGLTDVCCVTTRYFGGTLLGSGGLVRAYSAAARAALREAGTAVMRPWRRGSFACSYARYERLRRLLEERGARVEETLFGAEVEIVFSAPEMQSESFVTLLRDATAGEAEVRLGESVFRPEREEE